MKKLSVLLLASFPLLFGACQDLGPALEDAETISADYTGISDPRARWQAYQLKSYVLEQQRACFCMNGGEICRVYISNDKIVDVVRKSDGESIYREFGYLYKTANQLLDLADSLKTMAVARLDITYDTRFGLPNYIYVDPDERVADEEYGYVTSSVKKLLK